MGKDNGTSSIQALWRAATRLEKSKINTWIALRNSLAVALPLGIGIALHNPLGAVAITTGALNVSYSDGKDPYSQRLRRMLGWAVLGAFAVFTGSITGSNNWLAILVAAAWAFLAGLLISVSTRAGDLGLNTLVALLVFAARGAMGAKGAAIAALLVLAGGLLQTLFALLLWPIRRYQPERRAIGGVYSKLAKEIDPTSDDTLDPAVSNPTQQEQDTLAALGRDHTTEGERYRLLFDQADRLRMSTFMLRRLRSEVGEGGMRPEFSLMLDDFLVLSARIVSAVGRCLRSNQCLAAEPALVRELDQALKTSHRYEHDQSLPLGREIASGMEMLAGQLRLVIGLSGHSVSEGEAAFARKEAAQPWRLQVTSWVGTLRANLHPRSPYFRHAIRLATCVAIGDGAGRIVEWQRTYWIPMTIAVVLKPDFTTTFSRGLLRLSGTFGGLLVATVLYHIFPESALSQLVLVGAFTYLLRSIGPANYGVFSVAVSGLIVFLIAATGIPPKEVIVERATNTFAGGLFALAAYALWPTWERTQVSDAMAELLDSCRNYFQEISARFKSAEPMLETDLDDFRAAWRRARSNAEGSVDRFSSEPGASPEKASCLTSMLASSHALMHSMISLEATLMQGYADTAPEAFQTFAHDVELTLYYLAAALRGSQFASDTLPKLRDDHTVMKQTRETFSPQDELVLLETDRLTVSLNTLREQAMRYVGSVPSSQLSVVS
jgi:uncharacterized membrane protein YccC